jgi:hypothetical protein
MRNVPEFPTESSQRDRRLMDYSMRTTSSLENLFPQQDAAYQRPLLSEDKLWKLLQDTRVCPILFG